MFTKSKVCLSLALAFSSTVVVAKTTNDIEKITVTANKIEQSIENVLATVTVIERDAIEKSNVRDLPSLLEKVAGIDVVRRGGQGQNSSLFVRGASSSHSLIIIDGVKVGAASTGYKSISTVPLNSIERIEIIKGSRAAWYGSDALAGVIHIFTRNGDSSSVSLNTGSNNYKNAQLAYSVVGDNYSIALNAGYEDTDGYDVTSALALDTDGYTNKNIGLNAVYTSQQFGEFGFIAQHSEGDVAYDHAFGGDDLQEFEAYQSALRWQKQSGRVLQKLQFSIAKDKDFNTMSEPSEWHKPSNYETDRQEFNYLLNHQVSDEIDVNVGADWQQEKLDESVNAWAGPTDPVSGFTDESRENLGVYIGGYVDKKRIKLNAVARIDDNSDFGNNTTYNLSLGVPINEQVQLRASHGTGFKAPSFNDASSIWGNNPDLQPEESQSSEIGATLALEGASINFAIFKNDIDNLISWGAGIPENIAKAKIKGIEVTSQFTLIGFDNQLNLAHIDAKDGDTDKALVLRSENTVNWTVAKQFNAWNIALELDYRSSSTSYSGTYLPGYSLWHLSANYQMLNNLSFNFRVDNISDKTYVTDVFHSDWQTGDVLSFYQGASRQVHAGIRYNF